METTSPLDKKIRTDAMTHKSGDAGPSVLPNSGERDKHSSTGQAALQCNSGLRLLFVIDGWFPAMGGAELQALKLATALSEQGVSVEFLAPHLNKKMPVNAVVDGFKLTKLTYPPIKLLGSAWLNLRFAWYLLRHHKRYDSIHIHITQNLAATAGFVRPFLKIPVVTKVSGYYEFEEGVLSSKKMKNPMMRITRRGLRNVDFVQTISQQTEQKLLDAGFSKQQIQTIPNGIRLNKKPRKRVWRSGDQFVIGYCGRLQLVKGVAVLIQGFAQFLEQRPTLSAQVRIAGAGIVEPQLREQVAQLGLQEQVQFVGVIEDTAAFLEECDLYVQPSFAEGLPNSVIEAMNAGLPAVVSRVGGNQDLVTDGVNGYLFAAGDTNALAACLARCVDDEQSLQTMGEKGRQIIADGYGFDAITPKLIKLYRHGSPVDSTGVRPPDSHHE